MQGVLTASIFMKGSKMCIRDRGFTALAIADRVGHESIDITYRYAHLFPTRQAEMADKLDMERKGA